MQFHDFWMIIVCHAIAICSFKYLLPSAKPFLSFMSRNVEVHPRTFYNWTNLFDEFVDVLLIRNPDSLAFENDYKFYKSLKLRDIGTNVCYLDQIFHSFAVALSVGSNDIFDATHENCCLCLKYTMIQLFTSTI